MVREMKKVCGQFLKNTVVTIPNLEKKLKHPKSNSVPKPMLQEVSEHLAKLVAMKESAEKGVSADEYMEDVMKKLVKHDSLVQAANASANALQDILDALDAKKR